MIRLSTAAIVAGLLVSAPAFAADLVVESAAAPVAAPSASGAYASFFAGASLPDAEVTAYQDGVPFGLAIDLDFDTGYIIGGTLGTTILPSLRGEVEFSVIKSSISDLFGIPVDADSTGYNLLGNLWYDVDTGTSFTPYIGGGVGYGYDVVTADGSDDINTSGFLYQLGAGVRFAATDNIGLDLGYRYRVQPDAEISGDTLMLPPGAELKSSATNHIVTAGITVGF